MENFRLLRVCALASRTVDALQLASPERPRTRATISGRYLAACLCAVGRRAFDWLRIAAPASCPRTQSDLRRGIPTQDGSSSSSGAPLGTDALRQSTFRVPRRLWPEGSLWAQPPKGMAMATNTTPSAVTARPASHGFALGPMACPTIPDDEQKDGQKQI
jgi:hypothetical protein